MNTDSLIAFIFVGVVAIILLFVLYYISQTEKKTQKTITTYEPKPKTEVVETPSLEETPISTPIQAQKAEVVDTISEPKPKTEVVETPCREETPISALRSDSQSMATETPKIADKLYTEEIKTELMKSQKTIEIKEPEVKRKSRLAKISEIEGIGPVYTEKLNKVNIFTTSDLLEAGSTLKGRNELSEKTEISKIQILKWVNRSDLFRIRGIGEEYSDLLEEIGVDTVVELSRRNATNLYTKILEVNEIKKLVRRPPSLKNIENWIQEAKDLPRIIEY